VDRVAAQAYSAFEQAGVITVPKETVLTEPIRIAVHGEGGVAYGHQVVELGAFAEAVVVIDHTGDAVLAANVEYVLGDGAKLTVVSVQDWDDKAVHVGQHNALIGRDATFKSFVVTFGGDLVRLHPRVAYAGTGGEAELFGLYFTDAGQHQEHRLLRRPQRPALQVERRLQGRAPGRGRPRGVDRRRPHRGHGRGHDTYEMNRNLVLTDGARSTPCRTWRSRPARSSAPGTRGDRPVRRRAALLPDGPRHPGRRGPPSGGPRLLRRTGPADRRPDIEERLLVKPRIDEELEASV
jgi:Fe-S cluster assembly protein SufD